MVDGLLPLVTAYLAAQAITQITLAFGGDEAASRQAVMLVVLTAVVGLISALRSSSNDYIDQLVRCRVESQVSDLLYEHFVYAQQLIGTALSSASSFVTEYGSAGADFAKLKDYQDSIGLVVMKRGGLRLARNFYIQAPIVILDEPTSAIDALDEAKISIVFSTKISGLWRSLAIA